MKSALLIDGGYLRACSQSYLQSAGKDYDVEFIEQFAHNCFEADEYNFRIFYYDSPQYRGTVSLPVSGTKRNFKASDKWLMDLAKLERFAVRKGTLAFRGWIPKNIPIAGKPLTDADFRPQFEQKGVDMRIGLDIALFSERRSIDRIVIVSGDTDMIPAMKQARKSGLEIAIVQLPAPVFNLHDTLQAHADTIRQVAWP